MFSPTSLVVRPTVKSGPRPFLRALFVLAIAALVATATFRTEATAPAEGTRALWVTRATLGSPETIREMVRAAAAGGFNTLVVQVRGRGDSYFAGTLEPRATELSAKPSFDPLATVLDAAHATGLKVHAWVAVNLVSSSVTLPASREHVVYRLPEWLMVPQELAAEMRKVDVRSPARPRPAGAVDPSALGPGRGALHLAGARRGTSACRSGHWRAGAEVRCRRRSPRLRPLPQ